MHLQDCDYDAQAYMVDQFIIGKSVGTFEVPGG